MSTSLKGLKSYRKREAEQNERREAAKRAREEGRVRWLKLGDGESVKLRFLQELDPDADNYSEKTGIGGIVIEHNAPGREGFKRKAVCTADDDGPCFPCEIVRDRSLEWDDRKAWKQKERFYINVLVKDVPQVDEKGNETGELKDEVMILAQGNGPKSLTPQLFAFAEEMNTVTDRWFKVTRNGLELSNTSYVLTPLKEFGKDEKDATEYADDLFDIEDKVLVKVEYEKQEAHYLKGQAPVDEDGSSDGETHAVSSSDSGKSALNDAW